MQFARRNLKQHDAPAHVVHVVNPSGCIKAIQVSNTIDTPILDRTFQTDSEGGVHLVSIRVAQAFEQNGWVLLEELFKADGPDGPERFADFLDYQDYAAKCETRGVRPDPYPTDQLPDEVHARRTGQAPMAPTWSPRAKPKAKARADKPAKAKEKPSDGAEVHP